MTFALLFGLSLANESTQGEEKQDAWVIQVSPTSLSWSWQLLLFLSLTCRMIGRSRFRFRDELKRIRPRRNLIRLMFDTRRFHSYEQKNPRCMDTGNVCLCGSLRWSAVDARSGRRSGRPRRQTGLVAREQNRFSARVIPRRAMFGSLPRAAGQARSTTLASTHRAFVTSTSSSPMGKALPYAPRTSPPPRGW
jgi:hypothetical protein